MKTFRRIGALLLLVFVSMCGFTACSSDDDPEEQQQNKYPLVVAMSYTPSRDLLNVADIKVTYTDGNGQKQTETINGKFEKTVTVQTYPIRVGYEVSATLKSSYVQKESYDITYVSTINITKNGSPVAARPMSGKSLGVTDVEKMLQRGSLNIKSYFDFDSEGNYVTE